MANEQNLKPIKRLSNEEAKRRGSKGGIRSGQVRAEKKKLREQAEYLLSLPVTNDNFKAQMELLGVDPTQFDNQMLLLVGLYRASLNGNVNAFNKIEELTTDKKAEEEEKITRIQIINTLPECDEDE